MIGFDEAQHHEECDPELCVVPSMSVSQHKQAEIVRDPTYELGKKQRTILPCTQPPPEPVLVEPNADTIAMTYAARQQQQLRAPKT